MSYLPTIIPDIEDGKLRVWLAEELDSISQALSLQREWRLIERHSAPNRLSEGLVVFADGDNWDPGSGKGFYGYYDSSWRKLG